MVDTINTGASFSEDMIHNLSGRITEEQNGL